MKILALLSLLLTSGCDRESVSRLAYGTVQSMGQQRCMDTTLSSQWNDCMKSQGYDEYQRKRQDQVKPAAGASPN